MMASDKKVKRRHRWRALLPRQWTFLVWLAVVVAATALYLDQSSLSGFTGIVETSFEPVAPLETARLASLEVALGDVVRAGDILARMDTTPVDAQLAVEEAMLLEAESSISGYQQNILQLARQFDEAVRQAETSLRQERMAQARDAAELASLRKEMARREELLARRLISETEVSELRPRIAALEEAQAATPAIVDSLEQALAEARRNHEDMVEWLRIEEGQSISAAIEDKLEARSAILANSLAQRRQQLENYTLRANRGGIVSRILHLSGDVVPAGEEILRVVSPEATHVVGFLPEHHVHDLRIGDRLTASRRVGSRQGIVQIVVETIAPEVEALPARLSPIRGRPLRGRRVHFRIEGEHDLLPGETIQIERRSARGLALLWQRVQGAPDDRETPNG